MTNVVDPARTEIGTDLVVVGGGGAGLAAAAEGARLGLSVIVLEKAAQVGGTTAMAVGSIMAAQSRAQLQAGIADTPADHAKDLDDIRRAYGIEDDPELRRVLTENVAETVAFLRSIGINFLGPLPQPPHTAPRLHQVMPTSRAYIARLERHCRKLGVNFRVSTRATKLMVDGTRVIGVEAESPNGVIAVTARKGTLLASGDIGGNSSLMHAHTTDWVDGIEVYNPMNTGDGQKMAAEAGAKITSRRDMGPAITAHLRFVPPRRSFFHKIPPYPWLTRALVWAMAWLPKWLIRPFAMKFLTTTLGPDQLVYQEGAILVNREGDRFADESSNPNLLVAAQPAGKAYVVFDERFAKQFTKWPYFISTAPGVAFAFVGDYRATRPDLFNKGKNLNDLAGKVGFDTGRLAAAVAAANQDRTPGKKLTAPPFYALGPVMLYTMVAQVGLAVNTRFEVLNEAGDAIPGLYAAGGAGQGGFTITGHGHGLGWAFTTGRLAAQSVAEDR